MDGFRDILGGIEESELNEIMACADINVSGALDYFEWLAATANRKELLRPQKLEVAFHYFDRERTGKISLEQLKDAMGSNGIAQNADLDD